MRRGRKNLKINQQVSPNLKQMTCWPGPAFNRDHFKIFLNIKWF